MARVAGGGFRSGMIGSAHDAVSRVAIREACAATSAMMSTSLTMTFPVAAELISRSTPLAADPT